MGTDEVEMARLLALVDVAMADGAIAGWESKYYWDLWRPVTGLRESDPGTGPTGLGDGNHHTMGLGRHVHPAAGRLRTARRALDPGVLVRSLAVAEECSMAVSDSFLAFLLEQLAGLPQVATRRMFGGVGLYCGETFFGVVDNDTLFFKVDDTTVVRYRKRKMSPFAPIPGKPPMLGYYQVPVSVIEDADALAEWASEAVGVGQRAPAKKKMKRHTTTAGRASRAGAGAQRWRSKG
jgi:DNA transformation protein